MKYKIVVDSCSDLTQEVKADKHFRVVPLTIQVGGKSIVDDGSFPQSELLRLIKNSTSVAKTACPSPEAFLRAYGEDDAEMIFVVTLSKHLSGTYDSAELARKMYEEEHPGEKKIHVFNSNSACCGETQIAFKAQELAEAGASFEEIVEKTEAFRDEMRTYFVLEDMETLRKNGRLTGLAAILATALHIKPVMSARDGVIIKLDQSRGIQRALKKMVDYVEQNSRDTEKKILGITHVNCPERAEEVRRMICGRLKFRKTYVVDAAGLSTTYANDGGIVVTV